MKIRILLLCWGILAVVFTYGQTPKEKFSRALSTNNIDEQRLLAKDLFGTYSSFTYAYYQLMLSNLPKNSILITNALDDTFPLRILQLKNNYRTDIGIISLNLLKDTTYLNHINKAHHLKLTTGRPENHIKTIMNSRAGVFISTTVKSTYWYRQHFYLIGLTVQSSQKMSSKRLISFYKEYQKMKRKSFVFNEKDKQLIHNILPPLITLYKNGVEFPGLKADILTYADLAGMKEKVNIILAHD